MTLRSKTRTHLPSFFPTGSSNSIPIQSPFASPKFVSPTNRIVPLFSVPSCFGALPVPILLSTLTLRSSDGVDERTIHRAPSFWSGLRVCESVRVELDEVAGGANRPSFLASRSLSTVSFFDENMSVTYNYIQVSSYYTEIPTCISHLSKDEKCRSNGLRGARQGGNRN
jgi:hypothetical protein